MEPKIIREENLKEKDHGGTKVTDILNAKDWRYFNIAVVRKTGDNIRTGYDIESNVVYYVLDGEGTTVINGKGYHVKKGDSIVIPKGTRYKNMKGLTLLAIASPRFDRKKRVYVD